MKKMTAHPDSEVKTDIRKLSVFQQNNSGENKIRGIRKYGNRHFDLKIVSLNMPLPAVIDDTENYLPPTPDADMVLDFLKHPDLSHDLAMKCHENGIPVVASGKKMKLPRVFTPPV